MDVLSAKISKFYHSKFLIWCLLSIGILLRIRQYAFNRSLWIDEAALGVNFVSRSLGELFQPLMYDQVAPLGFLLTEKLAVQCLGPSEYVLRFFPLVAGILAMILFYRVAVRICDPVVVPLAVGIFAIAQPLVYFSSEVKQYSNEVLVTLVILWIAIEMSKLSAFRMLQVMFFAWLGAFMVWFSFPSVFVLVGAACALGIKFLREKKEMLPQLLMVVGFWLVSVIVCYLFSRRYVVSVQGHFENFWTAGFMPLGVSLDLIKWFKRALVNTFEFPGGMAPSILAAAAFVGGIVSFRLQKKTFELGLLLWPIVFALAASAMRIYPFSDRLLLYLVAVLILLVAQGAVVIGHSLQKYHKLLGIIFICFLLTKPVVTSVKYAINPVTREEIRPAFFYLQKHFQPNDVIYVYNGAIKAFKYYALVNNFSPSYIEGIMARDDFSRYQEDLRQLSGNSRVWIIFSHVWIKNNVNEKEYIVNHLDSMGRRLDKFDVPAKGAVGLGSGVSSVYLYDLNKS